VTEGTAPDAEDEPGQRRPLRTVALVLLAVVLLVVGTVVVVAVKLSDQIRQDDAFDDIVDERPQQYVDPDGGKPVNMLVMGQDRRAGKFKDLGGDRGLPGALRHDDPAPPLGRP
jgi:hypothetical protein